MTLSLLCCSSENLLTLWNPYALGFVFHTEVEYDF